MLASNVQDVRFQSSLMNEQPSIPPDVAQSAMSAREYDVPA
jgi:hypothetical protein